MRTIHTHETNPCNRALRIEAGEPDGRTGASHDYLIVIAEGPKAGLAHALRFQRGPLAEVGVNGITHEALLAILIDRVQGFQGGPFQCEENATVLLALRAAMVLLKERTDARQLRGVEGTHAP